MSFVNWFEPSCRHGVFYGRDELRAWKDSVPYNGRTQGRRCIHTIMDEQSPSLSLPFDSKSSILTDRDRRSNFDRVSHPLHKSVGVITKHSVYVHNGRRPNRIDEERRVRRVSTETGTNEMIDLAVAHWPTSYAR